MAFNNFNNQGQVFPPQNQGNFGQMPVSGQQMGGFQPSQSYGVQGFAPQQGQQFPGYQMGVPMGPQMSGQMGPPMNPQMRPQMGHQMGAQMGPQMSTQMGLQIGAFPSNVQLGHQFPKQQQIRMDQQRKQAEESMKKQEELMKKKQLEAKQRKLQQSFSVKKAASTDALDSLFGKNKKGGGSSMTDLIGSLGKETTPKSAATKATSIFSRPGGSVSHHSSLTPGQWGSGFMTSGSMTPQGSPASGLSSQQTGDADDFGDFSQGPSFPGQGGNDSVFSVFQEAAGQPAGQFGGSSFAAMGSSAMATPPNVRGAGNVFSQAQGWHGTNLEQSRNSAAAGTSTGPQHGSFPGTQNISTAQLIHGTQTVSGDNMANVSATTSASWAGPSNITPGSQMTHFPDDSSRHRAGSIPSMPSQGVQMTQFAGDISRARTGSIPEMMSNVARKAPNAGAMPQPGMPHNQVNMGNQGGGNFAMAVMSNTGNFHPQSTMGPHGGGFGSEPSQHGAVPVPSNKEPSMQLHPENSSMSATPTDSTQEPDPELEDSPERKLELLYGVTLPDWCMHGTDLPGIYKEIAEKTTDACDAIDTNRLFPVLMASSLPRDQLGHIWNKANRAVPGQLNLLELRIVLGLVALGQAGLKTERLTLEKLATCKAAPIPTIPEDVLQTKGRGWSFSEQSNDGSQSSGLVEGNASRGRVSSVSSDHSVDPNDKYSVFRTVDQSDVNSIAVTPSEDKNDRFGAFQSGGQSAMKTEPPPGKVTLFQSGVSQQSTGWNKTDISSTGWNKTDISSTGGHFQSAANQSFIPNKDGSGDFQGQAGLYNKQIPGVGQALNQDDFGDFQSEPTPFSGSITTDFNQKSTLSKESDFGNFETGFNETSSGSKPLSVAAKPQEDDFGDFQSGKESDSGSLDVASIMESKQPQIPQKTAERLGNFQVGGELQTKAKKSELAGINLFPNNANSSTKLISNIDSNSLTETDDFGDFQHSPGPSAMTGDSSTSISSGSSEKLASSLEKFKLSGHSLLSTQAGVKIPNLPENKCSTNEKDLGDKKKQDSKANPPSNFASFPAVLGLSDPSQTAITAKTSEDKYSALRDADFGSGGGLFSVQKPVTTTEDLAADDDFADFGGFEVADQSMPGEDIDFGAFKSTENLQNVSFGVFSDSSQAQLPTPSNSSKEPLKDHNQDFGDFNSFDSTHLSNPQPKIDSGGEFGAFGSLVTGSGSAHNSHQHSITASDSLINSVSLEPTERYKVLSNDSADMDQHASAWSRCLNSCLLTLATATLAIQKMGEQSVKQQVLESKEGATYFSAIVEIYRVTLRIRASITKSAPNNTKLKNIQQEIESTWKNIANFLSGSTILPSQRSLDFTTHPVSATEDGSVACGICLLNVDKSTPGTSKQADGKLMYGGRQYHNTCANFWCNRVDSVLPSLLPIDSLI